MNSIREEIILFFLADCRLMGRPLPDHHSMDGLTEDQSSVSDAESDSVEDSQISSHTGMYAENENALHNVLIIMCLYTDHNGVNLEDVDSMLGK